MSIHSTDGSMSTRIGQGNKNSRIDSFDVVVYCCVFKLRKQVSFVCVLPSAVLFLVLVKYI